MATLRPLIHSEGSGECAEIGVVAPIEVVCGDYRIVVRAGCDLAMLEGVVRAVERAR